MCRGLNVNSLTFRRYLETVDLATLLNELGASNIETFISEVKHFTEKEADKRDRIVLEYFGEEGVERIVNSIVDALLSPPTLGKNAKILDVGAGSGFFTTRVAEKIWRHLPETTFYALDTTPVMLLALAKKTSAIKPFLGIAENITGSAKAASKYVSIPSKFDAAFSTLMLHHCLNVEKVFSSLKRALKNDGKVVIIDLCTHPFAEFKREMGDLHMGFDPEQIEEDAKKTFSKVSIGKLPGICCASSGRCAELFIAYLLP
jgi:SAM-dependent methyltransferase